MDVMKTFAVMVSKIYNNDPHYSIIAYNGSEHRSITRTKALKALHKTDRIIATICGKDGVKHFFDDEAKAVIRELK